MCMAIVHSVRTMVGEAVVGAAEGEVDGRAVGVPEGARVGVSLGICAGS